MKNTIKFAALGACALAASSTAALAGSELPQGITTGIALGAPLPEGVYDVSIASYGGNTGGNLAYAVPVWLIWSTPWQIAGGRIGFTANSAVADTWAPGGVGTDSWLNSFVDATIKWNLGNGWNAGLSAGVYTPSTQVLPEALGRNYTAFQGYGAISYLAHGWNLSATGIYGSGGGGNSVSDHWQPAWFNLDLTATRKYGKLELGTIAYGSWDVDNIPHGKEPPPCTTACKQSQFALGALVGYDFGSFVAQFKVASDVVETNSGGLTTRGWITIIKPLWNPEQGGSLK